MNPLYWFTGDDYMSGLRHDMFWVWVTIVLSLLLAIAYCLVAINWYFQSKLARSAESKVALARLRSICLCCIICCYIFYATDMPWLVWRYYDVVLLLLVFRTWTFVLKMRGWSLLDERLARIDELERSARMYRDIAELLPHMVWTATEQGNVDFSNQRWREYVGDGRTWPQALHADDRADALGRWNRAIEARENVSLEARLGGPDVYRTFVIKATPIVNGNAIRWLGACADIEDQKRLALEKEIQGRQKSFFLNALSHDLRAPLHNVLLNAQLLKMSVNEPDDAESLDMIVENAVAAGDLLAKLLDFAKVGASDQNLMEDISLGALLNQIIRRFGPIAQEKGLCLRSGEIDSSLVVKSDRHKLERILGNLVDNAIKYTSKGGVTLEVAVAEAAGESPPRVGDDGASAASAEPADVSRADGGAIVVAVCDTGPGIPEANVPYLFDEFYQVNNYERDRSKGFGMGLAICRSLASHVGAQVRLASTGSQGSRFEIRLKGIGVVAAAKGDGVDRRRRPGCADGDQPDPQETGLCSV